MLTRIVKENLLSAKGIVGFYPANAVGDDINVYDDNGSVSATFYGIRQQAQKVLSGKGNNNNSINLMSELGLRDVFH